MPLPIHDESAKRIYYRSDEMTDPVPVRDDDHSAWLSIHEISGEGFYVLVSKFTESNEDTPYSVEVVSCCFTMNCAESCLTEFRQRHNA